MEQPHIKDEEIDCVAIIPGPRFELIDLTTIDVSSSMEVRDSPAVIVIDLTEDEASLPNSDFPLLKYIQFEALHAHILQVEKILTENRMENTKTLQAHNGVKTEASTGKEEEDMPITNEPMTKLKQMLNDVGLNAGTGHPDVMQGQLREMTMKEKEEIQKKQNVCKESPPSFPNYGNSLVECCLPEATQDRFPALDKHPGVAMKEKEKNYKIPKKFSKENPQTIPNFEHSSSISKFALSQKVATKHAMAPKPAKIARTENIRPSSVNKSKAETKEKNVLPERVVFEENEVRKGISSRDPRRKAVPIGACRQQVNCNPSQSAPPRNPKRQHSPSLKSNAKNTPTQGPRKKISYEKYKLLMSLNKPLHKVKQRGISPASSEVIPNSSKVAPGSSIAFPENAVNAYHNIDAARNPIAMASPYSKNAAPDSNALNYTPPQPNMKNLNVARNITLMPKEGSPAMADTNVFNYPQPYPTMPVENVVPPGSYVTYPPVTNNFYVQYPLTVQQYYPRPMAFAQSVEPKLKF